MIDFTRIIIHVPWLITLLETAGLAIYVDGVSSHGLGLDQIGRPIISSEEALLDQTMLW